jgi:hypothetical protein
MRQTCAILSSQAGAAYGGVVPMPFYEFVARTQDSQAETFGFDQRRSGYRERFTQNGSAFRRIAQRIAGDAAGTREVLRGQIRGERAGGFIAKMPDKVS